jgi:hypothetical protein
MSDASIRALARRILERREFEMATRHQSWNSWIKKFLALLDRFAALRLRSPGVYWMVVVGAIGIAIALMVHVVVTLVTALRTPESPSPSVPSHVAPDLAAEAESFAESGRYLEAAHSLMIACFRVLAEASVIELRPDRPNGWIRTALRGSALNGSMVAEIDYLIARTERRWFGDRRNDPEIYFRWRSALERLSTQGQ